MTAKPKTDDPPFLNPHYEGATPEMVGRALLRHAEPAPQPKGKDQADPEGVRVSYGIDSSGFVH